MSIAVISKVRWNQPSDALMVALDSGATLFVPMAEIRKIRPDLEDDMTNLQAQNVSVTFGKKSLLHLSEIFRAALGPAVVAVLEEQGKREAIPCSAFCVEVG